MKNVLDWTRTSTPLGTGPQPAAYTIPPRGLIVVNDKSNITPLLVVCQLAISLFSEKLRLTNTPLFPKRGA